MHLYSFSKESTFFECSPQCLPLSPQVKDWAHRTLQRSSMNLWRTLRKVTKKQAYYYNACTHITNQQSEVKTNRNTLAVLQRKVPNLKPSA